MMEHVLMKEQPWEGARFHGISRRWEGGVLYSRAYFSKENVGVLNTLIPEEIAGRVTECVEQETGYLLNPPECTSETKWCFVLKDKQAA